MLAPEAGSDEAPGKVSAVESAGPLSGHDFGISPRFLLQANPKVNEELRKKIANSRSTYLEKIGKEEAYYSFI